jgi:hypothetical protein
MKFRDRPEAPRSCSSASGVAKIATRLRTPIAKRQMKKKRAAAAGIKVASAV